MLMIGRMASSPTARNNADSWDFSATVPSTPMTATLELPDPFLNFSMSPTSSYRHFPRPHPHHSDSNNKIRTAALVPGDLEEENEDEGLTVGDLSLQDSGNELGDRSTSSIAESLAEEVKRRKAISDREARFSRRSVNFSFGTETAEALCLVDADAEEMERETK